MVEKAQNLSHDPASQQMIQKARDNNIKIVWDRYAAQQPQCEFGELGICCRICDMGPCRIDSSGQGPQVGVCGANADTIAARNLSRMVAAGAAAHSDHGRDVAHALLLAAEGRTHDYHIKNPDKLKALATLYGINTNDENINRIAKELGQAVLAEFGRQQGVLRTLGLAPDKRQAVWEKLDIMPRGVDREIVELMHRTHMGVDNDYNNILKQCLRTALADGWGGSMLAAGVSDILFGAPEPVRAIVNLGVLKEDYVNLVVLGHESMLAEAILATGQDPDLNKLARTYGAQGINIAGMGCTANEILVRHGVPSAGNFLQQELAILTGAVDVMLLAGQGIMPALTAATHGFHTKLITTSLKCKFPGVEHIEFKPDKAGEIAKNIIRISVENYKNRVKNRVSIPPATKGLVTGFAAENIFTALGGKYRATFRPLNDAIISGRLRGAAGVVGCNNPKTKHDWAHVSVVKELIKHDVLVLQTGCSAIACAKEGLLDPASASQHAGDGLKEICEAVGIPPVLHVGSCVDNSRILRILSEIVKEGGLGEDLADLPFAAAAPEWISEKDVAIGFYFVASGFFTVFGTPQPVLGSKNLTRAITRELENTVGGKFTFEKDPVQAAHLMIKHMDLKRKALQLAPVMYGQ